MTALSSLPPKNTKTYKLHEGEGKGEGEKGYMKRKEIARPAHSFLMWFHEKRERTRESGSMMKCQVSSGGANE